MTVSLGFASSPSRSSGKIGEAVSSVSQLIASQLVHLISGQTSLSNYLGNKFMWSLFFWALAFLWAYGLVPCRKSEYLESPSRSKVHRVTVPHPPLFFYNKKSIKNSSWAWIIPTTKQCSNLSSLESLKTWSQLDST